MTLRPTDMLEIQSAIDAYERKFPRRPTPSAEVALAWRLGKKGYARRQAALRMSEAGGTDSVRVPEQEFRGGSLKISRSRSMQSAAESKRSGLMWLAGQIALLWSSLRAGFESSDAFEDSAPVVQGILRVGFWGVAAVLIVSVFLLGAVVGGFK